jgi:hypothetical protein
MAERIEELNLEGLSNKQIADLYRASTEEARKQRNLEQARRGSAEALNDQLGFGDTAAYLDDRGFVIEGKKPETPKDHEFIDNTGYITNVKPVGEKAAQWQFIQENIDDPEVRAALKADGVVLNFETYVADTDILVTGLLARDGWHIKASSEVDQIEHQRFKLSSKLTPEQAQSQAVAYIDKQLDEPWPTLDDAQISMLSRLAVSSRADALGLYIRLSLPEDLRAESETKTTLTELLEFCAQDGIREIVNEGCLNTFLWSRPELDADEFSRYVQAKAARKEITFPLLDALANRFAVDGNVAALWPVDQPITHTALDDLPDEEVAKLWQQTRALRNQRF